MSEHILTEQIRHGESIVKGNFRI